MYHTPGPIGGYTLGFVLGPIALLCWIGIYLYYFKFYRRKQRLLEKKKAEDRLKPYQPKVPKLPPAPPQKRAPGRPPGAAAAAARTAEPQGGGRSTPSR